MARPDEISSTEKLLDRIRKEGPEQEVPEPPVETGPPVDEELSPFAEPSPFSRFLERFRLPFRARWPFRATYTVGAHLDDTALRLVKIRRQSGDQIAIVDVTTVFYKPPVVPGHVEFPRFLHTALSNFCPSRQRCGLWTVLPTESSSVRYVKIPRVARKEIPNAAFWSYRKETPFDEKSLEFDFEVLGPVMDGGIQKLEVLACAANIDAIQEIRRLFGISNHPLTGLCPPAVGTLNFFKAGWIDTRGDNVCALHIDKESSRIDVFTTSGALAISRDIRTGLNSMVEALAAELEKRTAAAQSGAHPYRRATDRPPAPFAPTGTFSVDMAHYEAHLGPDTVFELMAPVVDRLIRQVDRTLKHFSLTHNDTVARMLISGEMANLENITRQMGIALGLPVLRIDPFSLSGDESHAPVNAAERMAYTTAAGAALCDTESSINFVYSQKEKEAFHKASRNSRLLLAGFLVVLGICFGYYLWQQSRIGGKNQRIQTLSAELAAFRPQADQAGILKLVTDAGTRKKELQTLADKYWGLAVMGALAKGIHPDVRLVQVTLTLPPQAPPAAKAPQTPAPRELLVEGIVTGTRSTFESRLTAFLLGLKASPLFSNPRVEKRSFEYLENTEVLRFTARLDLV